MGARAPTKWTPGPWRVDGQWLMDADGATLGEILDPRAGPCAAESDANARLIAAAPELYEALKAVVAIADRRTVEFDAAHAALAKALGDDWENREVAAERAAQGDE